MESSSEDDCETEQQELDHAVEHDLDSDQIEKIDAAIKLNDIVNNSFLGLEAMLTARLEECRARLEDVRTRITQNMRSKKMKLFEPFKYNLCGMPYFRYKTGAVPLDNPDTTSMRRAGVVNYIFMRPGNGWSARDKDKFKCILLNISRELKEQELESKLRTALRAGNVPNLKGFQKSIKKQMQMVANAPLSKVVLPIEQEYDWELIAGKMKCRHKPGELRTFWKQVLHPHLIQTTLNRHEYAMLKNITPCPRGHDWLAVVRDLGTRRSEYQCFVYYRTVVAQEDKGTKWTEEEDEFLREVVECYRSGDYIPWPLIATCIDTKSRLQIYNRYMNSVRPHIKKGKFTLEEDAVIMAFVDKYGEDFIKMARFLPGRTSVQLRLRYTHSLGYNVTAHWTVHDDRRLLELLGNGVEYAEAAKHFRGRNRTQVRMRHCTLLKFLRSRPNADLALAPRRQARLLQRPVKVDLVTAVNNLARQLESGDERTAPIETKHTDVDRKLVNFFISELAVDDNRPEPSDATSETKDNTNNVRRILLILRANLEKDRFSQEGYASNYINLMDKDPDEEVLKPVRTYSKKNAISTEEPDAIPITVWSDTRTFDPEYILPPNYDTIKGCKALLIETYLSCDRRQLSMLRNPLLKTHYDKFVERLEVLFAWPLVMSFIKPELELGGSSSIFHDNYDTKEKKDEKATVEKNPFVGRMKGHHAGRKKNIFLMVSHDSVDLPAGSEDSKLRTSLVVNENHLGQIVGISDPDFKDETPTRKQRSVRKVKLVDSEHERPPAKMIRRNPRIKKK